jgi:hypothetical protein
MPITRQVRGIWSKGRAGPYAKACQQVWTNEGFSGMPRTPHTGTKSHDSEDSEKSSQEKGRSLEQGSQDREKGRTYA